jgi:hypothetical protein
MTKGFAELTVDEWESVIHPLRFKPMTHEDQDRIYKHNKLTLRVDISGLDWFKAAVDTTLPSSFIARHMIKDCK